MQPIAINKQMLMIQLFVFHQFQMEPESILKHGFDEHNYVEIFRNGRIRHLVLEGQTVIKARQPFKDTGSGEFLMFPWVNRLEKPQPGLPPQMYDGNGLPIHGMVIDKERKIQVDNNIIKITLKDKIENVPEFSQHFIVEKGKLTVKFQYLSKPNDVVCFGYHPYLEINGKPLQQLKINTNIAKNLALDDKLLPVYPFQSKKIVVNNTDSYDNLFQLEDKEGYLQLVDEVDKISVKIGSELKYWQIYTPSDRTRIAVEPMSFCGNLYSLYPKVGGQLPNKSGFSIELQK